MTRIRTLTELQDILDGEHAWRLREMATFAVAASSTESTAQRALVRAGVPLLYAHWEGFVRAASTIYLKYVANQRLRYDQLSACFVVFGAKRHLASLVNSKKSHLNIQAVTFFVESMGERANLSLSGAVNTQSNLSSSVFENIALSLGLDPEPYRTRFNLIDESLLERRNRIAHGAFLDLNFQEYRMLSTEVQALMRRYKDDVLNAASLGRYRRECA